jgi:colanic acid biosynthesis glycosyl transferase WcaI
VALVYSSPATAASSAAVWRRLTHTPFVLLIQDLWPDSVTSSGRAGRGAASRVIESVLNRFVSWTYRAASHIVVISPGMIDVLISRGVPPDKISLVYNWSSDETDQSELERACARAQARRELDISESAFVVTYAGNQGSAQGLDAVINAAILLREDPNVLLVLAGDGVEAAALVEQAQTANCANVRFTGRLDPGEMNKLRAATDVQLVSLIDDALFAVTMPSKIQSILASGQPMIVMAPGDAAEVAVRSGAGWAVAPGDAAGLAGTVAEARRLPAEELASMARSGRDFYMKTMAKGIGGPRLDEILRRAARSLNAHSTNGGHGRLLPRAARRTWTR